MIAPSPRPPPRANPLESSSRRSSILSLRGSWSKRMSPLPIAPGLTDTLRGISSVGNFGQSAFFHTEETVKDTLNVIETLLLDVSADVEAVAKHFLTDPIHNAKLFAQIRQILQIAGLPVWLRRAGRSARPAKHVTQDLAEDVAARRLPARRTCLSLWYLDWPTGFAGKWYLNRSTADDHWLDASLLNALLQLLQDLAEKV